MAKVSFTEREIHVYTCMTDTSRKCIAMIDGFTMIFKGDTAMQARQAADEWRKEAIASDKLLTKTQKEHLLGAGVQ